MCQLIEVMLDLGIRIVCTLIDMELLYRFVNVAVGVGVALAGLIN